MNVIKLEDLLGTEREVKDDNWASRRFLLKDDNVGFSLHDTVLYAGTETYIWYKNHIEAVYCIEGEAEIETVEDGKKYQIKPGTMYCLDGHEKHYLRAKTDFRVVCVFNPALVGNEIHDEEGVYKLPEESSK
ncbi:ectoine synthase [Halobacillus karajensis]|uniref:L-ectoine synthase n=1 Tax=Halobacillus karajensis TaxID=195088 RepID=A0A024P846_9BACI|nr:ectoine synthase [Halobacillus karajensis]CDQ20078.1 L-ectoine synthase [Halobacillus karajensis]CDQ25259.1 L-ectoine synthase [Halobacillus karajensis]CDQ28380.1 L-ectoine synthase [Halobacillus karajensis]SEI00286.1 ectoine synthase [Halobacillus karajensis]